MQKVLVIIDMQNDFISGSLSAREAQGVLATVCAMAKKHDGPIYYTLDTHDASYKETLEGKRLPIYHCQKESHGWQVPSSLARILEERGAMPIEKNTFGSLDLAAMLRERHQREAFASITLVGIATDICVLTNALLLRTYLPNVPIYVPMDATAGTSPEAKACALEAMKQVNIDVQ